MPSSSKKQLSVKAPLPLGADYKDFGRKLWDERTHYCPGELCITLQYSMYDEPPVVEVSLLNPN